MVIKKVIYEWNLLVVWHNTDFLLILLSILFLLILLSLLTLIQSHSHKNINFSHVSLWNEKNELKREIFGFWAQGSHLNLPSFCSLEG